MALFFFTLLNTALLSEHSISIQNCTSVECLTSSMSMIFSQVIKTLTGTEARVLGLSGWDTMHNVLIVKYNDSVSFKTQYSILSNLL